MKRAKAQQSKSHNTKVMKFELFWISAFVALFGPLRSDREQALDEVDALDARWNQYRIGRTALPSGVVEVYRGVSIA